MLSLALPALGGQGAGPPAVGDDCGAAVYFDRYRKVFAERDLEAIRDLYVADQRFAWLEDGVARYSSPDAIVNAMTTLPPGMAFQTEFDGVRSVMLPGDFCHASAHFKTTVTGDNGATPLELQGMVTLLLQREANGWRALAGHTSTRGARR